MDKSWLRPTVPRCSREYILGCRDFLKFAWENRLQEFSDEIYCPYVRCINKVLKPMNVVENHILGRGFLRTYVNWTMHGEVEETNPHNGESNYIDDMHTMLHDAFRFPHMPSQPNPNEAGPSEPGPSEPNKEAQIFYNLLKEADTPLYPGCDKSKLSFLVRMLHLKCLYQWSNKSFDMMLEVLKDTFPKDINMPKNYYEAKIQLRDLGMDYIKIDACPNDCMLYWKDQKRDEDKQECDICGTSRWTTSSSDCVDEGTSSLTKPKKKAAKVLRYFPLTPRLQRLYMCSKTAEDMRWHDVGRTKDGGLRHPADSEAWKCLDKKYPTFGSEIRNIRLGLASDGFNPFSNLSTSHSTWPVVLIPYNLPPWMCMKQPYFIMSLLIPGPSSPGNNIDVYIRPLVEELKELWAEGVETYDAHSKQNFQMHAALLWTINDFPALANLSRWSTKGNLACPSCHKDTCSTRLVNGGKSCYMGSRRFTPLDHAFRKNKSSFDNKTEMKEAPKPLSGHDILEQLNGYDQITFRKAEFDKCGRKRKKPELPYNWKKISIFFELPYWKDLTLRHNLDVMHIEKNNGESWLGTLLNIEGKTKDNLKARQDLVLMGIRKALHAIAKGGNKYELPAARYTMSLDEKRKLCKFLQSMKVPDNYSSNISRRVNVQQCKIPGLKSHDWHVLLQELLPVAARGILSKEVTMVLVEFSNFYKQLCSKTLWVEELERLEYQIVVTLCKMEMIFPPSFFDVMVHFPIHLAGEAKVAVPVFYRWMYPIERYLFTLKKYVRNKSRLDGSIAEAYLADECLTFCSRYLDDGVETKFNRPGRNDDCEDTESGEKLPIFVGNGRLLGKGVFQNLTDKEWEQARLYVLSNCDEVAPFIKIHKEEIRTDHGQRISARSIDRIHNEMFGKWFEIHVQKLKRAGAVVSSQLEILSLGPSRFVSCYKGCILNGFRFHTKDREAQRKTKNSGVFVSAETPRFSSAIDMNPVTDSVGYYGVVNDIVELRYNDELRVALFKCSWWDVLSRLGLKNDEFGFTTVNFTRTIASSEPFILASQAQQVFYLQDNLDENWRVVLKTQPRDLYDMGYEAEVVEEHSACSQPHVANCADITQTIESWTRAEIGGIEVIATEKESNFTGGGNNGNDFIDDNCNDDSDCNEDFIDDNDVVDFV